MRHWRFHRSRQTKRRGPPTMPLAPPWVRRAPGRRSTALRVRARSCERLSQKGQGPAPVNVG